MLMKKIFILLFCIGLLCSACSNKNEVECYVTQGTIIDISDDFMIIEAEDNSRVRIIRKAAYNAEVSRLNEIIGVTLVGDKVLVKYFYEADGRCSGNWPVNLEFIE